MIFAPAVIRPVSGLRCCQLYIYISFCTANGADGLLLPFVLSTPPPTTFQEKKQFCFPHLPVALSSVNRAQLIAALYQATSYPALLQLISSQPYPPRTWGILTIRKSNLRSPKTIHTEAVSLSHQVTRNSCICFDSK